MLFGLAAGGGVQVRSIVVEDHLVIRVPVQPPPRVDWREKKGPKCIPVASIRGAAPAGDHVDFLLHDRRLVRAELDEDCPALDFYEGFYLSSDDDRVCARRDEIRSRMGASCRIDRFRLLVPKRGR